MLTTTKALKRLKTCLDFLDVRPASMLTQRRDKKSR